MNDIDHTKTKISDLHVHIERKAKQVQDFPSTINVEERQERLMLAQVKNEWTAEMR